MAPNNKSGGAAASNSRLRNGLVTPEPTPDRDLHKDKSSNGGGITSEPNKEGTSTENTSGTTAGSVADAREIQRQTVERILKADKGDWAAILDVAGKDTLEVKKDRFMKNALMLHPNVTEGDEKEAFGCKLRTFSLNLLW